MFRIYSKENFNRYYDVDRLKEFQIDEKNRIFSTKKTELYIDFFEFENWTINVTNNNRIDVGLECKCICGSNNDIDLGPGSYLTCKNKCEIEVSINNALKICGNGCSVNSFNGETFKKLKKGYYINVKDELIYIKDINEALLNLGHRNAFVKKICNEIVRKKF